MDDPTRTGGAAEGWGLEGGRVGGIEQDQGIREWHGEWSC